MNKPIHIFSTIILAAGLSSRMRKLKPLLPLAGSTMIEVIIRTMKIAGVKDIIVVVGHEKEKIIPVINKHKISITVNDNFLDGMYASIQAGIKSVDKRSKGFFIMPCDVPFVKPEVIKRLIRASKETDYQVIIPSCNGKGGHPPLVSLKLARTILTETPAGGLSGLFKSLGEKKVLYLEIGDPSILLDANTPSDYEKIVKKII